jgi:4'-phosphopantetheinyl transferase
VAARGILRVILGSYLRIEPQAIRFCYTEHGKPELDPQGWPQGHSVVAVRDSLGILNFNLTHSEDLFLVALARGRRLGIDVEKVRLDALEDGLPEQACSPQELGTWRTLHPASRQLAFFSCWTRKEAYLKARGEGLILPLTAVTVSLSPGDPPAVLRVEGQPDEARRWFLLDLRPAAGFVSALVVEGQGWSLHRWSWRICP